MDNLWAFIKKTLILRRGCEIRFLPLEPIKKVFDLLDKQKRFIQMDDMLCLYPAVSGIRDQMNNSIGVLLINGAVEGSVLLCFKIRVQQYRATDLYQSLCMIKPGCS